MPSCLLITTLGLLLVVASRSFTLSSSRVARRYGKLASRPLSMAGGEEAGEGLSTTIASSLSKEDQTNPSGFTMPRRGLLLSLGESIATTMTMMMTKTTFAHAESSGDFASIAQRAAELSKSGKVEEPKPKTSDDSRCAYDFALPVQGKDMSFANLVRQEVAKDGESKVKAIVVLNMKQDDPVARLDIAEMINLAARYGRKGEFAVVMSPTDQGYSEPDPSPLIRQKLEKEYGYGINPATTLTDKMILLGTGAHPFWRWLEGTCRTPWGLGRIEANFEKFLLDGRTGLPLRRYPRNFAPSFMKEDIEAVLAGKPLPPVGAKYMEGWREAREIAATDTYRFQKGINYFDQ